MNYEEHRACTSAIRQYAEYGVDLQRIPRLVLKLLEDPQQNWRRPDNETFRAYVERNDEHGLGVNAAYLLKVCEMEKAVHAKLAPLLRSAEQGRRRTEQEEDVAQRIIALYTQEPTLSNRRIAQRVGCDPKTVTTVLSTVDDNRYIVPVIVHSTHKPTRGNSAAYTLQRVQDTDPAMYERVIAGELSANKAARLVGVRNHTVSVRMDDATSACATISKHMNPHLIEELVRRLREVLDDRSVPL